MTEAPPKTRFPESSGPSQAVPWHRRTVRESLAALGTEALRGLDPAEVERRRAGYGVNELVEGRRRGFKQILWEQLRGALVLLLLGAAGISLALGEHRDALAILTIVLLNAAMGFVQEFRAEKALEALKRLAVPRVRVRRAGMVEEISARELVPGDLLLLAAGDRVAADGRLIESVDLQMEEAALTGESEAVAKQVEALDAESLPLGDRRNRVFLGTAVARGRGLALVTETGMATQLGSIAEMLQAVERVPSPLSRRLARLSRGLLWAASGIVATVMALGLLLGEPPRLMLLTGLSLAVAAVPEGLPAVATIALALGARRMLARNALIRRLQATETLGSVTVICTDKTGTLTQNRMTVEAAELADGPWPVDAPGPRDRPAAAWLLAAGALNNDSELPPPEARQRPALGDATEIALARWAAAAFAPGTLPEALPRIGEIPFDADRRRMTTFHRRASSELPAGLAPLGAGGGEPEVLVVSKGALESILSISDRAWRGAAPEPLGNGVRRRLQAAEARLADQGMRVLALALGTAPPGEVPAVEAEGGLVLLGLVGLRDPLRPTVPDSVLRCRRAGIRPVMITGDHPRTAVAIAREAGFGASPEVLLGRDLADLSGSALGQAVDRVDIFARVSPRDKLEIIQAFQERGHLVAMTGDGVNDAPGLQRADIGVAMGITGTDVAKEAAEIVLLDDDFSTIVGAVEEGRTIYDNIRRFVVYILASNAGEVAVMLMAPILGLPLPLLPLQILWINLITDGPPALTLGLEPGEPGVMGRPPRPPREPLLGRGLTAVVAALGLGMAFVTLALSYPVATAPGQLDRWRTMVFTALTLSQLANALALRSFRHGALSRRFFANPALLAAVSACFLLQLAAVYLPPLQGFLRTVPLTLPQLATCLAVGGISFLAIEGFKALRRWAGPQPSSRRTSSSRVR